MITTTAFVSALSCVELVKLVQKAPLTRHRNAFINLALPFFAFTVPLPAEQVAGLKGISYTLWDRLSIREGKKAAASGGMTMRSLIRRIKKQATNGDPESVDVSSVSCGPFMLYANFLHEDDDNVLDASIWGLIRDASTADEFDEGRESDKADLSLSIDCTKYADFAVVVEDLETGAEVELPLVRVTRHVDSD
jgi:Ubiquitin fold domain